MKQLRVNALLAFVALTVVNFGTPTSAVAQQALGAALNGLEETPAVSTNGNGVVRAVISADGTSINFVLIYFDLEGAVTDAHIHLGQAGVAGGVVAFLCAGCPPAGAVSGTITAAEVLNVPSQGIAAGEIGELVRAMRRGATYVNVHSSLHPGGEIRGQIK